jgi:diguanylate cyclase (GGDEF)-like protein
LEVGERIRAGIANAPLLSNQMLSVTVSIGVATIESGQSISELLAAADAAVYLSKSEGRNQVRAHRQPTGG